MFLILKEMFRVAAGTKIIASKTRAVDETLIRHSLLEQFTDRGDRASRRFVSRKRVVYACAADRGNSLAIRILSMRFISGVMATARRRGRRTNIKNVAFGCKPKYARALSNVMPCATNLMWSKNNANEYRDKNVNGLPIFHTLEWRSNSDKQ
jgi:hypothetical protein